MKIFCVIGEESGDYHASKLLEKLGEKLPELRITGTGGKNFRKISAQTHFNAEELSVIGFWEVLKRRKFFYSVMERLEQKIEEERPDVLLLVDYPGMNLRLAKKLRGRVRNVVYYICPQVWVWKKKRAFAMKELLDLLITLFPFEVDFLKDYADMDAHCFGHPVLDRYAEISRLPAPFEKRNGELDIALLPGSRTKEISEHMPLLCQAARKLSVLKSNVNFHVIKAGQIPEERYGLDREPVPNLRLVKQDGKNHVHHCDMAWCCSGTASLECAVLNTPPIIFYKTSPLSFLIYRLLAPNFKMVGMPNILMGKRVFPELLQSDFNPDNLVKTSLRLLGEKNLTDRQNPVYKELRNCLGKENSYQKTADFLAEWMRQRS